MRLTAHQAARHVPVGKIIAAASSSFDFGIEQFLKVYLHGLGQGVQVIAPLQAAHQAASGVGVRDLQDQVRQVREILGLQTQRANGVALVGLSLLTFYGVTLRP